MKGYFEKNRALGLIKDAISDASIVRIATAYFEAGGYSLLEPYLRGKEVRLIVGRPERSIEGVESVIREFVNSIETYTGDDRAQILRALRDAVSKNRFFVGVSSAGEDTTIEPKYYYLHAKIYIADTRRAVVSSSNMTRSGLLTSVEAGCVVDDTEDVEYFVSKFDEYFALAENISGDILELLDNFLNLQHPFIIYARSLIRLYEIEGYEQPGTLPELADYQRPIVSRLIRTMEDFGGVMLVASTGLGKTVIGSHLLAYLRMSGMIDSAVILCPAGLKSMWRDYIRRARISGDVFSYYLLSVEDWRKYRDIVILEREMKNADDKTLVLLDESHHLRNSLDGTELRLRNRRIIDVVGKRAKVLLMTATPYSKDVSDINSQLELLPKKEDDGSLYSGWGKTPYSEVSWRADTPSMLSELPPCTVFTTPSVVKYYSKTDETGSRYVVFSGNEKRYFPHSIMMKNISYDNCVDLHLEALLSSNLLYKKEKDQEQAGLFSGYSSGKRDPLLEARVVHQGCSSTGEFLRLAAKLGRLDGEGYEKLQFQNQGRLTEWSEKISRGITSAGAGFDDKIVKLAEIVKDHHAAGEKIVIFCHYIETAKYIKREIESLCRIRIETNADKEADAVEDIIDRFAPVSNIIARGEDAFFNDEKFTELDVLVATGALAEGFNFQDANVLVNFDLPWTVLSLAQRMGRILRPWKDPREIYVYTMIPSTMSNTGIMHALNWKKRLDNQNIEMSSFLELPAMVGRDWGDGVVELVSLAKSMQIIGDQRVDLDDVLKFIENTERIESNTFVDDLARISDAKRAKIKRLPPGIKGVLHSRAFREEMLYILIRNKNRYYPALFRKDGSLLRDHFQTDGVMNMIMCAEDYAEKSSPFDVESIEAWIKLSMEKWSAHFRFPPGDIFSECAMTLLPE